MSTANKSQTESGKMDGKKTKQKKTHTQEEEGQENEDAKSPLKMFPLILSSVCCSYQFDKTIINLIRLLKNVV